LFKDAFADVEQRKSYRDKFGQLEIGAGFFREIVTENFYPVKVGRGETHFAGGGYDRDIFGIEVYEIAANDFTTEGVGATEEVAEGSCSSIDWAGAIHYGDGIDYGQSGMKEIIYADKKPAEIVRVFSFCEMPAGLLFACHGAEHIFDGKCRDELLMRFELGQINDDVGVEGEGTYTDDCSVYVAFPGFVELTDRHIEFFQRSFEFQFPYAGKNISPCGRIGDEWFCPEIL
jgi:hypothetical protein